MLDQLVMFGLTLSALYSLAAIGFTLIFGVGRISNLSHGTFLMLAGYAFYILHQVAGISLWLSFLLAVLTCVVYSVMVFKGIVEKIMGNPMKEIFSTLILAIIVEQAITLTCGDYPLNVYPIVQGVSIIGAVRISNNILVVLGISWVAIIALLIFIHKSNLGRAIRAISMNRELAVIMGIDTSRLNLITWTLAGILAGLAGVFYSSYTYLKPDIWLTPLVMSFSIVIIGGIGSVKGSLVAANIIGFVESYVMLFVNERLRGVITLAILILILLFRPKGLFGEEA